MYTHTAQCTVHDIFFVVLWVNKDLQCVNKRIAWVYHVMINNLMMII